MEVGPEARGSAQVCYARGGLSAGPAEPISFIAREGGVVPLPGICSRAQGLWGVTALVLVTRYYVCDTLSCRVDGQIRTTREFSTIETGLKMFVADSGRMEDEMWVRTFSKMAAELPSIDDWTLEFAEELKNSLAEPGWKTHQQTRAFARFHCSKCRRKWASNRVLVFFRMKLGYPRQWKGSVKMYIFWQQCERCNMFCDATFSQQNIQITLENLLREIRKQCYEKKVHGRPRDLIAEEPTRGPHMSELCEACINSVCPGGRPERSPFQPVQCVPPVHPPSQENVCTMTSLPGDTPRPKVASLRPLQCVPPLHPPSQENMCTMAPLSVTPCSKVTSLWPEQSVPPVHHLSQENMFKMTSLSVDIPYVPSRKSHSLWLCLCVLVVLLCIAAAFLYYAWLRYKRELWLLFWFSEPEFNWGNFLEMLKWLRYKMESGISEPETDWENFVETLKWCKYKIELEVFS